MLFPGWSRSVLPASRRRDCHFADTPSPCLLECLLQGGGGCSRMTVSPTERAGPEEPVGAVAKELEVRVERAVEARGKGSVLVITPKAVKHARQRQCLRHKRSGTHKAKAVCISVLHGSRLDSGTPAGGGTAMQRRPASMTEDSPTQRRHALSKGKVGDMTFCWPRCAHAVAEQLLSHLRDGGWRRWHVERQHPPRFKQVVGWFAAHTMGHSGTVMLLMDTCYIPIETPTSK